MARRISRTGSKGRGVEWPYEVTIQTSWKALSRLLSDEGLPGYWDGRAFYGSATRSPSMPPYKEVFVTDAKTAMYLKLRFG